MKSEDIMIFGDSYSTYEGHISAGYAVYYSGHRDNPPDVSDVKLTWWGRLIAETDSNLVQNNSWSGSTIGYTGYNNSDCSHSSSFIYRFEKLLAEGFFEEHKIDRLFVFGGTNDSWSNAPLGESDKEAIEESDLFCVLPAIKHFIARLAEKLPDTKLVIIGNCDIKSEITGALALAAERAGATYVGLSGVDKINGHPTELGMEQIKDQILASV
ncbi:MAG: hypothetical protein J6M03_08400 [Clostridia bacterium]|nr:hypothetical protein [Clostridia bacterium]